MDRLPQGFLQGVLTPRLSTKRYNTQSLQPDLCQGINIQTGFYAQELTPRTLRPGDHALVYALVCAQERDYTQEPLPRSLRPGAIAQEQGARQENHWGDVPRGGVIVTF